MWLVQLKTREYRRPTHDSFAPMEHYREEIKITCFLNASFVRVKRIKM